MSIRCVYISVIAALCSSLCACSTFSVTPQTAGARPALDTDEAGLWMAVEQMEERIKTSPQLVRDAEINRFANDLACKVAGEYCKDLRVYVMDVPRFNASMAPNGTMLIWTGLLLRAESEAHVAFVIGHEIAHYVHRHSLARWRAGKSLTNASAVLAIGTSLVGIGPGILDDLAILATIYGFSRENERDADRVGLQLLTAAGYDPNPAAEIWSQLIDEVNHSSFPNKKKRIAQSSVFNTHPVTAERVANLQKQAEGAPDGKINFESYRDLVGKHLGPWLEDNLRLGDYGQSEYLIDRLISYRRELGVLHYYKGELFRMRGEDGDSDKSLEQYSLALNHADAPARTWRQIGQAHRKLGRAAEADAAFRHYLELEPNADDKLLIEGYLSK